MRVTLVGHKKTMMGENQGRTQEGARGVVKTDEFSKCNSLSPDSFEVCASPKQLWCKRSDPCPVTFNVSVFEDIQY